MRRILSQILFAVLTAALLLCGYFAAPLLGTRLAAPSLSGEKETGATGAEIAAASPAQSPLYTFWERGKISADETEYGGRYISDEYDLKRLVPLINVLCRGASGEDGDALWREDGITFVNGYTIQRLYRCASFSYDGVIGSAVAYGPGGIVCTGDDTYTESGTKEEQQKNLRQILLALRAMRKDQNTMGHAPFSDLLGAAQYIDDSMASMLFFLLCDGKMQIYHDGRLYYLAFSDRNMDQTLYLALNLGERKIIGINLLYQVAAYGGEIWADESRDANTAQSRDIDTAENIGVSAEN